MANAKPNFAVGEIWNTLAYGSDGKPVYNRDGHLVKWIQAAGGCVTAFDFTTKEILQTAIPGMIGLRLGNAVTFIDNHDTGFTQNLWPFPPDKVIQGYVYILTHLGIPSIMNKK
uniref:1,4-alpha-D-glucan glucanohydrolase n=1 Tax=Quercus lobata TaxID=97700 RepID=A0A7N2MYA7_QUELO